MSLSAVTTEKRAVTISYITVSASQGGREVDDFVKYLAKHATSELKGWDRAGKPKKTEL